MRKTLVSLACMTMSAGYSVASVPIQLYDGPVPCQPDWGDDYGKHPNQIVVERMRSYVKPYNHKFEANQRRWKHLQKYHGKKRKELLAKEAMAFF